MSNQPDRPWSEDEKYALLSEILKKAGIPSSYLVSIIHEFRITPNWDNIPLPHGRSLNSCKMALFNMTQPNAPGGPSPGPGPGPTPPPPPALGSSTASASVSTSISSTVPPPAPTPPILAPAPRQIQQHHPQQPQRPLIQDPRKRPLDTHSHQSHQKPPQPAPRAIQPKPPASNASYSSESPAPLSPRWSSIGPGGEPPRKRGRPSKAETERRRAAAQARGETYPPPRRSASRARPLSVFGLSIPPSPTSPDSVSASGSTSAAVSVAMGGYGHTPSSAPPPGLMPASVPYDVQVSRAMPGSGIGVGLGVGASPVPIHGSGPGPHDPRDPRDIPNRMGLRELPRPSEMGSVHPLPSPHALQLGPPDAFRPRLNSAGERMFVSGPGHHSLSSPGSASVSGPSDRFSPEGRRDSAASAGAATGMRDRELGSGSVSGAGASYSDLRNSSTPGEPR